MSKLQAYLEKKRIADLNLPKIWVVKSHYETGLEKPFEAQVTEISHYGTRFLDKDKTVKIFKYKLDVDPYEIQIEDGKQNSIDSQYASGFGDLWSSTIYCSFSEEEAYAFHEKEKRRLTNKPLLTAINILNSAAPYHDLLSKFAREKYNEKFKDIKKPYNSFHYYSGFSILSENSISVEYMYGAGDIEFDDSFIVTLD